ncbi:MAG: phosphatidylglycerophosphatase A [Thermodesulfovibrionia bacterium]
MLQRLYLTIATLGYIGYIPYAPGTFGSLVGLLLIILLKPNDSLLILTFIITCTMGTVSANNAERSLGRDSPHIVIDEFCGYLLGIIFLPKTLTYLIPALILFRLFDILKPQPIKGVEDTFKGGIGVMLDDLVAGVYTNICMQLWRLLL